MKKKIMWGLFLLGVLVVLTCSLKLWLARRSLQRNTSINIDRIFNHIYNLSADDEYLDLNYRVAGLAGEEKAATYIEAVFQESGLNVKRQSFVFNEIINEEKDVLFTLPDNTTLSPTTAKILSDENFIGEIGAGLVNLGYGTHNDFIKNKEIIKNQFVLLQVNKTTSVDDFSALEYSQEVKGVLVFDPNFSPPQKPVIANHFTLPGNTLIREKVMVITTLTSSDYELLLQKLSGNRQLMINASVNYKASRQVRQSQNIVAKLPKSDEITDSAPLIIIGAHYDSAEDPGANDNASGVAMLMELGDLYKKNKPLCEVRFVAFGAEEVGLFGSNYYFSQLSLEDRSRLVLMINLDGLGVGNTTVIGKSILEEGEPQAHQYAIKNVREKYIPFVKLTFADSDHFHFSRAGVPTLTLGSLVQGNVQLIPQYPEPDYLPFSQLEKQGIYNPKTDHTLEDTVDLIESSNQQNLNFQKTLSIIMSVISCY